MINIQHGYNVRQKDDSHPEWDELNVERFHHVTQSDMQLKTYQLSISEIFYLILLHHD